MKVYFYFLSQKFLGFHFEFYKVFLKTMRTLESGAVSEPSNEQKTLQTNKLPKMSTKVGKKVITPAKAVSKVTLKSESLAKDVAKDVTKSVSVTSVKSAKSPSLRLSEEDKKADTANYIFNPNTKKHV